MSAANGDTLQRIVGPDVPPTDDAGRWERSKSPWHADAFPDEFKDRAPEQGDRKTGWLEIDWCGNAIGWVPDGTVIRPNTEARHGAEWRKQNEEIQTVCSNGGTPLRPRLG